MRVLMITSEWPTCDNPQAAPFIVRQVKFLRRAGIVVDVFHFRGAKSPSRYLQAKKQVRRKLDETTYDLVHAQFGQSAILAVPKKIPLVITYRGDDVLGIVDKSGKYSAYGHILR